MDHSEKNVPAIEIEKLCVEFVAPSGKKRVAVDQLDFTVNAGECVGLIGPNGAGKTTTIKVLMGFLRPTSGTARVLGDSAGARRTLKRLGYLPEVALYYPFLTARETLQMYATLGEIPSQDHNRVVDELLDLVGLAGRDREPLRHFSKGMLQRIGIAQAIMGNPELLILDEVTSGLNPVARYDVRDILLKFKSRNCTVFFSSHELSEVALICDRVVLMDNGKILEEHRLNELQDKIRRHVATVKVNEFSPAVERGVSIYPVYDGVWRLVAQSRPALDRAVHQIVDGKGEIIDIHEETGSLEDYFVQVVGHRIT